MSRRIITQPGAVEGGGERDGFFDKIVKYIPADIIGAWIAAAGVIAAAQQRPSEALLWIVFLFLLIITPLWVLRHTQEPGKAPARTQAVVATGAFAVWVFALGGPFAQYDFWDPLYGALALIGYSLIAGLITPSEQ